MSNKPWYIFSAIFAVIICLFFLHLLTLAGAIEWKFLTNPEEAKSISDALGLFSALFSGFAAFGLLYTIDLQRRALYNQGLDAQRATALQLRLLHFELLKLSIHDSDLYDAWSGDSDVLTPKLSLYSNLILSHWEMMFENKLLDERRLKILVEERMHGPIKMFWEAHRESREQHAKTASDGSLKFHYLVDQGYHARVKYESGINNNA